MSERRPLAQMPEVSVSEIVSGDFVEEFEKYTLDQFPLRDDFRSLKAWVSQNIFRKADNNDIYAADGYAVKMEYPLKEDSLGHALEKFEKIYEQYLKESGSEIYLSVIPDKNYFLAESSHHLSMDYEKLFSMVKEGMPWSAHIDLTGHLAAKDYYFTDTHWRQENLLPVAGAISEAMGVTAPKAEDFVKTKGSQKLKNAFEELRGSDADCFYNDERS